jgi:hypothetical protein
MPFCVHLAVDMTGRDSAPPMVTKFVQISNEGANILKVYFTKPDFDADINFISLAATTGFYEGPAEVGVNPTGPQGRDRLWFRSAAGATTAVVLWYLRRG